MRRTAAPLFSAPTGQKGRCRHQHRKCVPVLMKFRVRSASFHVSVPPPLLYKGTLGESANYNCGQLLHPRQHFWLPLSNLFRRQMKIRCIRWRNRKLATKAGFPRGGARAFPPVPLIFQGWQTGKAGPWFRNAIVFLTSPRQGGVF